jgi:predicted transcriptional regulator
MPKPKHTKSPPPLSIRLDAELMKNVDDAAVKTKLCRSDVARLAMERGLKIVVAQLTGVPAAA